MSKAETSNQKSVAANNESAPARGTRFDPPHEIARGPEESSGKTNRVADEHVSPAAVDAAMAESESIAPELVTQFRSQAEQLAGYLDQRQKELDIREADLNAKLAQYDNSARNSRLWFQERHHDLQDRTTELNRRSEELATRITEWTRQQDTETKTEQAVASFVESDLLARQDELELQEFELRRRQSDLDEQVGKVAQRELQVETRRQQLDERERNLKQVETLVARGEVELEDERRDFHKQRTEMRSRLEQLRRKLGEDQLRQETEFQRQRETLSNRSQHLERRNAALDQLQSEVLRVQRETLEMRLATEELWGQLSGAAPPAAITQSLARLRAKLTDHYRLQAADVASQRREMEELAAKVAEQHERIAMQKRELDDWSARAHAEVESQAARLVGREEELDREQDRMQQLRVEWETQRRKLETELRKLRKTEPIAEVEFATAR
jgi:DNA repair exonuclease SbcCD ATPase subunit